MYIYSVKVLEDPWHCEVRALIYRYSSSFGSVESIISFYVKLCLALFTWITRRGPLHLSQYLSRKCLPDISFWRHLTVNQSKHISTKNLRSVCYFFWNSSWISGPLHYFGSHLFSVWCIMGLLNDSYLVDPASSHMLVSKIKPCMSKYKQ